MPNLPGNSQAPDLHVPTLPHHLLCVCAQDPADMPWVPGETSNSPGEVIFIFFVPTLFFKFSICQGTALLRKLPCTSMTSCRGWRNWLEGILNQSKVLKCTWCLSNYISFFIFNNHLQSIVVMMTHITKISLCHTFSLWAMCFLQVHALCLSLHRKRRSSMVAGPSPTALSSTSCWSPVRGSRWWAGGGSSTGIFSQALVSTRTTMGQQFQRWAEQSRIEDKILDTHSNKIT